MLKQPTILFLCTGNSCRSQMAEAILKHIGGEKVQSLSAGSHPAGFIHSLANEAMYRLGISMDNQYSKSWDEFKTTPIDVVITLCDAAANETCPTWLGSPVCVHWPMPDPSYSVGKDEERVGAAIDVAHELRSRLEQLLHVDLTAGSDVVTASLSAMAGS